MTIAEALENLAARDMKDVEREWGKYVDVKGNASITFNITRNMKTLIEGEYRANGMKMWTLEYGSGSAMDTDNPLLAKYQRSRKYNSLRGNAPKGSTGTEIRTRPKTRYRDLDGRRVMGSGIGFTPNWSYGLNAEWLRGEHQVVPIEPHHIIKDIVPRRDTVHKQQFKREVLKCIEAELKGAMK